MPLPRPPKAYNLPSNSAILCSLRGVRRLGIVTHLFASDGLVGIDVGPAEGATVGDAVGLGVGAAVGYDVGPAVLGGAVGISVGPAEGATVGDAVGLGVSAAVGYDSSVGAAVGENV